MQRSGTMLVAAPPWIVSKESVERGSGGVTPSSVMRLLEQRAQVAVDRDQVARHRLDGVDAEPRARSVGLFAVQRDLAPDRALVADADAVGAERLGDDQRVGDDQALLDEPAHARVADADRLLVGDGALDDPAGPARASQGLDGDHLRGQAALHVGGAAAVDPAVAQLPAEGVRGPVVADRDDVVVAVEMDGRPVRRSRASRAGSGAAGLRRAARACPGPPRARGGPRWRSRARRAGPRSRARRSRSRRRAG